MLLPDSDEGSAISQATASDHGAGDEPAPAPHPGRVHKLITIAGESRAVRIGFAVAAVGLSLYAVISRWNTISSDLARIGWLRTLGCIPLMFAAMAFGMLSWRRLLRGLGSPLPLTSAGRIYFIGQLGKYLPGSVWPMVSQMELGKDHAIPRRRSITALLIALLVSLSTGVLTGAATLPFLLGQRHPWLWVLLALVPVLIVLLYPRLLWPILRRLPKLDLGAAIGDPMSERMMLGAIGWSMLGWLTYGLHVALLATAFHNHGIGRVLLMSIGGYALAWCAGMIAFVLPAGAGARDVALILALATVTNGNAAVAVAVVSRAVTTVADLSWAGLAVAGMRHLHKGDYIPEPAETT